MKLCAACSETLPKEKFSKKQWQLKQQRRCKECIAENREVQLEAPNDDRSPSLSVASEDSPPLLKLGDDCESASNWTDGEIFKEPPPRDECPICMLPFPLEYSAKAHKACCGKVICGGCMYGDLTKNNRIMCPFCRTSMPTSDREFVERYKKRVGANDALAMHELGWYYDGGRMGLREDWDKAMGLYLRAGEFGCADGYYNVAAAYYNGDRVEMDVNKAKHYYTIAAMGGHVEGRHNLGILEAEAGNLNRAMKHWMISAGAGCDKSLKNIREGYLHGYATKDDFEKALRAHKEAADEMRSDQREAATAFIDQLPKKFD